MKAHRLVNGGIGGAVGRPRMALDLDIGALLRLWLLQHFVHSQTV